MTDTETGLDVPMGDADRDHTTRVVHALIADRDFLLRSIADLEAEHAAGELTDDRFQALHDQYTVQAATVLRALEQLGTTSLADAPLPPPRRRGRPVLAAAAVALALVAGGGVLLARSVGDRQPGQTITGNAQSAGDTLDGLARAARQRPDDYDAQLAYASALMEAGEAVEALRTFDVAARLEPSSPLPKAYAGWLVFLAGLTDEALARIDSAIAVDPNYADARFFRGMVLLRGRNDPAGALVELRRFLELAPPGAPRDQVQQLVDGLEQPSSTTTKAG